MGFLSNLFDTGRKELKRCEKIANVVMSYDEEYKNLTDEQLQDKTFQFKKRYKDGESLDSILPEESEEEEPEEVSSKTEVSSKNNTSFPIFFIKTSLTYLFWSLFYSTTKMQKSAVFCISYSIHPKMCPYPFSYKTPHF